MTFEEAAGRSVSRETVARLERYAARVEAENQTQNLVSAATLPMFRERHIIDSLQLLRSLPAGASVADIGSGAGLPGIVIACTLEHHVTLIEPRRMRAEFLERLVAAFDLPARVERAKAEAVNGKFDTITARAVAPLDKLVAMSLHLAHRNTVWLLPKGRNAQSELEVLRRSWQCDIGEVPSVTDPDARVITLRNVSAKVGR